MAGGQPGLAAAVLGVSAWPAPPSILSLGHNDDDKAEVSASSGIAGKAGELAAAAALEREVGTVATVAKPYREGRSGAAVASRARAAPQAVSSCRCRGRRARRREQLGA